MARHTLQDKIEGLRRITAAPSARLLDVLPKSFADRSPTVRASAVLLVADRDLREAVPLVEPLLRDNNAEVRLRSAEFIGIFKVGKCLGVSGLTLRCQSGGSSTGCRDDKRRSEIRAHFRGWRSSCRTRNPSCGPMQLPASANCRGTLTYRKFVVCSKKKNKNSRRLEC